LALLALSVWSGSALASNVEIKGSMEGAIKIANGDFVAGGYIFSVVGAHPEERVLFAEAKVVFQGTCSNGSPEDTLVVNLSPGPAGGWVVPANSHENVPTGDEKAPKGFEGSTVAHVCGGSGTLDASSGATFSATVKATAPNSLQIKFHYRDPNAKGKGNVDCSAASSEGLGADVCGASWSSTPTVTPEPMEPSFTIEKLQKIQGSAGGFTKEELTGQIGQTVDYELIVKNTGELALKFGPLTDSKCTNIKPSGATELQAGEAETFTCEHLLTTVGRYTNTGTIEGNEGTGSKTSNEVLVVVPEEPNFSIFKEQRIQGEGAFTKEPLTSEVAKKVEYRLIVTNTGNASIKFGALTDAKCTNIQPAGPTELKAGESETFTCEHVLVAPDKPEYTNTGLIEGAGKTKESNTVVVKIPAVPPAEDFSVEKEQRITGEFTKAELTGKVGQTVFYKIIVKNTGQATIKLEHISDANCTNIVGPAKEVLAAGESTIYTCEHVLTEVGVYTNVATVTGNEKPKESNKVVVKVPTEGFTVEKLQKITGTFTKSELTGKIGDVVHYEIVVINTGEAVIKVEHIVDLNCTNIVGPSKEMLATGESAIYTCEHTLTEAGTYTNVAVVTGNEKPKESNKVVVTVPKQELKAECTIEEGAIVLQGVGGAKRHPFTVYVKSLGIKTATFYVDGRKVETLTSSQAKKGRFSVRIDPRKLGYGVHRVSVKTVMADPACASIARSGVFVRPRSPVVPPKFTG
jgi:hypothetical protein